MSSVAALYLLRGQVLPTRHGSEIRVIEWAAEGSYSRVYRAELATGPGVCVCAVKLAKLEVDGSADRLRQEEQILLRRRYVNVPMLLDSGSADAGPFLALEWVQGESLRALLHSARRLPLVRATMLLRDSAAAVADLHSDGIAHRDVRADNLLVERTTQQALLTDLGTAGLTSPTGSSTEKRSDVAALAALFHEMLTGAGDHGEGGLLTAAAGYNPAAVELYEFARSAEADAQLVLARCGDLLKLLGARVPTR